ncbi:MAG TPA: hypothetical protein VE871_18045, partial [Longimicrobium sp.]|nr:hypothetical protein [Longimicrobium sp.]
MDFVKFQRRIHSLWCVDCTAALVHGGEIRGGRREMAGRFIGAISGSGVHEGGLCEVPAANSFA